MGCVSSTDCIVAIVQKPDDGVMQPMENSPPGIHTMPSGAFVGAGVLLGIVGAKGEAVVVATSSAATAVEITPALKIIAPSKGKRIWFGLNIVSLDGQFAGCFRQGNILLPRIREIISCWSPAGP